MDVNVLVYFSPRLSSLFEYLCCIYPDIQDCKFCSRYSTNFLATVSSVKSTAPFSVAPSVIAFLCVVTNARLSRCNSDNEMERPGNCNRTRIQGKVRLTTPPKPPEDACSIIIMDKILLVMFSNVWRASVGARAACQSFKVRIYLVLVSMSVRTALVPAFAGLTSP